MNLGAVIKNHRTKRGFSQDTFSRLCRISQTYLSQIENNKREPSLSALKTISHELNVPLPILFFLSIEESDLKGSNKVDLFESLSKPIEDLIHTTHEVKENPSIRRVKHLEAIIGFSMSDLKEIASNISDYYSPYVKKELKKDGTTKKRDICPTKEPLTSIQKSISKNILGKIILPSYVLGGVKGSCNLKNAAIHKGNKYKFCTDLKNYFPSINHRIVYSMFTRHGFSADIAGILTKLTTFKGSVPQGASTSTQIANLVFLPIDELIYTYCKERAITYTRFVDDLTFSSQIDFKQNSVELLRFIHESPFNVSHKKTFYTEGKAEITGALVGQNKITTTSKFQEKLSNTKNVKSKEGRFNYKKRVKKLDSLKSKNFK